MRGKLRLIPVLILAAAGLLGVKVSDLWLAVEAQASLAQIAPAAGGAEAPAAPAEAAAAPSPERKPPVPDPLLMSPAEIEGLQKLAERRAALDRRAQEMAQQEVLLKAANQRLDEKLASLASLERDLGGIVEKQDAKDEQRIKSLVKIYETMKPREAARIFEELDLAVVLEVLERMKEAKAAPILASMEPAKAKTVTAALADRREHRTGAQQAAAKR
jgi:flagellar motility protein MotE (MotC chaperone)